MQNFYSIEEFESFNSETIALTIGNFDGVHAGHRFLLQNLRHEADILSLKTGILTFKQHTKHILSQSENLKTIHNPTQKTQALADLELVDYLILEDFSNLAYLSAQEFVSEVLVKKLKVKLIIVGSNHQFGKDRVGDFDLLLKLGQEFGFTVKSIDLYRENGEVVSSSRIRDQRS
jgi:riboflavin kinase/FMN adenylyltransferase